VSSGAAQAWFIAGSIVFMLAGGLHALGALLDTVRPTFFAPIEDPVKAAMEGTGMRFRRPFRAQRKDPSGDGLQLGI